MVSRERKRSSRLKLKYKIFHLNFNPLTFYCEGGKILEKVKQVKTWNRFPREVAESPQSEIFKTQLNTILDKLL